MTIANDEQAEYWNSAEQTDRWVRQQEKYDRMLAPFGALLLSAAALSDGYHVLDVGCGCGALTLDAARTVGRGTSTGIDLSAQMLERARQNAARLAVTNAAFEQGDAQTHHFGRAFDAVFSRFGVMFFADPVAAFANLRTATRPGGRLTFACWQPQAANDWLSVPVTALAEHLPVPDLAGEPGAPGMFGLAEPDRIRHVLAVSGWRGVSVTSERRPVQVGGGSLDDAVTFVRTGPAGRKILDQADPEQQARAVGALRAVLARHASADGVYLDAAIWLVQASA